MERSQFPDPTLASHPHHQLRPATPSLSVGQVEKIRLKLQPLKFIAASIRRHVFKLSCTSAILPLTQESQVTANTGLGGLGRAPLTDIGCVKIEPCVKDLSITLTAGRTQSRQSMAAWRKLLRTIAIGREKPICYFVFYLFQNFNKSEQLGCSTLSSSWKEKSWNENSIFQTCKKLSLLDTIHRP